MWSFKISLTVFILLSVLALLMHSAKGARIHSGGIKGQSKNNKESDGSFLFARNREHLQNILMQVDVETGSFVKTNRDLPNTIGMSLDEATRTIYARDNENIYSIDVDSLTVVKSIPIVNQLQIADLHYDKGFNKLIGIVGRGSGDKYAFVEFDIENAKPNLLLEFQGRFHRTAYDAINHMYYTTSVENGAISQFNMTHRKLQRTYQLPTRVTGLAVDGHTNILYACTQHANNVLFAKLDLKTGKLNEFNSELPGVVEALGAFDHERGIYYGATRIQNTMHQLLEINVENGDIVTKPLPASFYDVVFVPSKKSSQTTL